MSTAHGGKVAAGAVGLTATLLLASPSSYSQVTRNGNVTSMNVPAQVQAATRIDYARAKSLPQPMVTRAPAVQTSAAANADPTMLFGAPGFVDGAPGTGETKPVKLMAPIALSQKDSQDSTALPTPQEYGTSNQPYTTSQVNAFNDQTVNFYPYRAAGKLFFNIGTAPFICSASLIAPGIIVTAAHCVMNYGSKQFYSGFQYAPAYNNGVGPYGIWTIQQIRVMTSYFDGTDNCTVKGVVCANDVALLTAAPQNGKYPGAATGWFGYAWNYGYNPSGQALYTQLGYPKFLDGGALMERTDSQGFIDTSNVNNSVIGSLQTGGSSGGPWIINFGLPPANLDPSIKFGSAFQHQWVTHVTSWGYDKDPTIKQQGASPFTDQNIVQLVNVACSIVPTACQQ